MSLHVNVIIIIIINFLCKNYWMVQYLRIIERVKRPTRKFNKSLTWRTILFFACEKFSHANIIFICGFCCKQLFCVFPSSCKHFFSCIQFISVLTASANNLFQNFPPPTPSQKINGPSPNHLSSVLYGWLHFKKGTKCTSEGTTPSC